VRPASRQNDAYHQARTYVGKILRDAEPTELPILQQTRFEFVINLKIASNRRHCVLLVWASLVGLSPAGQEHGPTIPLVDKTLDGRE
jgi:hypothetical protein